MPNPSSAGDSRGAPGVRGLLLRGGHVCGLDGYHGSHGWVLVAGERIAAVGREPAPAFAGVETLDCSGSTLVPGFIDLHVHGALGHDAMDASPEALGEMARFYAAHGVTSFLATTMTAPLPDVRAALGAIRQAMEVDAGGARLLGAHVEGPYINAARMGAQDPGHIRPPRPEEYWALLDTGVVRLLTLAPEVPGAEELARAALGHGVCVSIGHTQATYAQMVRAMEWGVHHVTHLFNGMEPLHHRQPGAVGAALVLDEYTCQVIADGVHVHPAVLRLVVRAKGPARVALVTDAMRGTGMPEGEYDLGGQRVVVRGGEARLAPGEPNEGHLAGSTLTLDRAVAIMRDAAGLSLCEAVSMATDVPARALGLSEHLGALKPGMLADIAVLSPDLQVRATIVGGRVVYRADAG